MAQIMVNVAGSKGWENPSALDLMAARISIKDWSTIPSNYQNAVAGAYARKLLSGDENGNFNGAASTTRAQAAVVLCSLYDASTTIQVPTYVNSNRLVSGKTPSESNVYDDLVALKERLSRELPVGYDPQLHLQGTGTATGVEAFAYMLSDKVFGAMAASKLKDPRTCGWATWSASTPAATSAWWSLWTGMTSPMSPVTTAAGHLEGDRGPGRPGQQGYCLHPLSHQGLRRRHPEQRRKGH